MGACLSVISMTSWDFDSVATAVGLTTGFTGVGLTAAGLTAGGLTAVGFAWAALTAAGFAAAGFGIGLFGFTVTFDVAMGVCLCSGRAAFFGAGAF
jgi:hypothetical protein